MGTPEVVGVATGTFGRRTKTSILQYRVARKKPHNTKKEPLINVQPNDSDDYDSSTTSDLTAPRTHSPIQQDRSARSSQRTQNVPDVSDNDDTDDDDDDDDDTADDHKEEEEDSVGSVYTTPDHRQEEPLCISVSMDTDTDESAPMDERADRHQARRVAPTPPPMPMDEQAIDAMIQRSLRAVPNIGTAAKPSTTRLPMMDQLQIDAMIQRSLSQANEIIKNHRSLHGSASVGGRPYVTGLTDLDDI
jgi:hypothetical protein